MEKIFLTKGVNDCWIVLPQEPTMTEKTAAEEVQSYLEKALDVKYPIVSEQEAKGKCIYIGKTEFTGNANVLGKSTENWIIAMYDGSLILTGGNGQQDRGIIYAAYHFLEDFVGVRWWNPYEEDVLSLDALSLDEELYREGTPCFDYRKSYMDPQAGPEAFHYLAKTRTNAISPLDDDIPDSVYDATVMKYGGARWAGRPDHVHTMHKFFPADIYFEKHPEWWAWNKVQGKHLRTGSYCFSNEEFCNTLLAKLLTIIKEDVELAEKTGVELPCFYSLSIDDVNEDFFCQCEKCSKTISEAGYTGYALKLVNKVAKEVAKVYPFAKIEMLVYANFIEPPKDGTLPEKNCIIQLADLFSDMLRDIYAPTNEDYFRLLKSWSKICQKAGCELYIYDYVFSSRTNYPLPLFYRLKKTTKAYRDYGVKGIFTEIENTMADFLDINKYMLTHLLENPDADEEALIEDFVNRYYGKAAKFVKEYMELLREASERNTLNVLCCGEDSCYNYIDAQVAIKGSELLDKAKEAVGSLEPFGRRVNWLRKPLDAVMCFKFFELKKMAEAEGERFDFDIKNLKTRVIAALEEHAASPLGSHSLASIQTEISYFSDLPEEADELCIPEEFHDIDRKDIFQFSLLYMPKYVSGRIKEVYGYSAVEDQEATASKVMKLSYDTARGLHVRYSWNPTSKNAERRNPLTFKLQQKGENIVTTDLYREDLVTGQYRLYHLGSVSGIATSHDTRLSLFGGVGSINLSGLAITFPMDACDIYVSMKFTGEVYGGNPEDENAIYLDRMIIIRK